MQQYILGIDIGTGSTKGVAMDLNGKVTGSVQHHYDIDNHQQGVSEQDPELIWEAFVNCINEMAAKLASPPLAVSLSSAMHSLILADNTGKALSRMMTWADVRSESIASTIKNSPEGERLYRLSGTPYSSYVAFM